LRQQLVGLFHLGGQLSDQLDAPRDQLGAMRGEVPVPHIECVEHTAVTAVAGSAGRLEQRRALSQHSVVVRAHRADRGSSCGGQFVEVAAALARIAPHQRQVLGREQHGPQNTEDFTGRADGGAVQPRLVGPSCGDFEVDGQFAAVVHHDRRHHRSLGARPDQRCVRRYAMRA
jgi:hypothetical protein